MKIYKQTKHYIVLEKNAGIAVHPTDTSKEKTLRDILITNFPSLMNVGEKGREGIVHRLDKDASGLMVVATTEEMRTHLKRQFQMRQVVKEYLCLVYGVVVKNEGIIRTPIKRKKRSTKMSAGESIAARDAMTTFIVEKRFQRYTLLRVRIHTGRTHQIRVHMLSYGHPVVGDRIYKTKRQRTHAKCPRLFLHAAKLSFLDIAEKKQTFISPLPTELSAFLRTLAHQTGEKQPTGVLFILSGPTGAGKTTIMKHLLAQVPWLYHQPTYTTRPKRPVEKEGRDHYFLTTDLFKKRIKEKKFIEWAIVHKKNYYGTGKKAIHDALRAHRGVIIEIEVQGVRKIIKYIPDAVSIFIQPERFSFLRQHIETRPGITEEEITRRLKTAKEELATKALYKYIIINHEGKIADTIKKIRSILEKHAPKDIFDVTDVLE